MAKILIIADPNDPLGKERGMAGQLAGHQLFWFSIPKANLSNVTSFGFSHKLPFCLVQLLSPFYLFYAIVRIRPDIIHVHYARQVALTFPLLLHPKVVVSTMGGDILPDQSYRGIGAYFVRMLLNHAVCITSKSDFMDVALAKIGNYKRKIRRITWGIDMEKFRPDRDAAYLRHKLNIPKGDFVFFDPRLAQPLYNKDIIITAFSRYLFAGAPSAVLIIGEASPHPGCLHKLHKMVDELGIKDRVRFAGAIPHEQMPDYYALADVTVCVPSSDGLPQTIFEALASGSFLIAGNLPQYAGLYDEGITAKTVLIKNADAIAEALIESTSNPRCRTTLAEKGRMLVSRIGNKRNQFNLVNEIYSELLRT